ncbi:D-alanyl-D-alanine carboxypeptidase/D-alanyl-D-alanine endopeptidase [Herbiconiux ginsengi]|uniref:D-alanyl-D-alanine carboxypeptidase / D-alanyl-D-alanine-endopeptidase (Penicillin-binding protein 4) n=1 Tax=Herbiconiux ginsengi TaxID=381665 RepID=A0A1H3RGQ1_9MICO|nr:D-alanyl-D-alanine carboxypeptidase/D-alanyl-D-alanine-endopeptidase [Herbiconiux ginsengi]SDZ24109.1 D-alanyl-D-alanine carboxypeptidase / D-alanyl-D-alanine-endopeptidase (penicillin-binding protein 4) [Herbiconiux ginsengi]
MLTGRTFALVGVAAIAALGLAACTAQPQSTPAASSSAFTDVPGLDQTALDVMNQPAYANGQWAISVQDIDTGEQIVSLNADTFYEPGSIVKTYSIGAAWQQFGPDSTVVTPVKSTGQVIDGTLTGDLVLVGQGDLTMGGRTKPDGTVDFTNLDHNDANGVPGATLTTEDPLTGLNDLAAQVKASGITTVSGDVIVDDRLWDPAELVGEPITPIIINQNVIDLTTTPGAVGEPSTTAMSPQVAPWTVDNRVTTVAAGERTGIQATSTDQKTIVLTGQIAADAGPTVSVFAFDDPATFARTAFIEALGRAGVTVTADPVATNPEGALPDTAAVSALPAVAELTSLPFLEEATYTMKISYNRGAQTFICRLAVASGSTDCDDGLGQAGEVWSKAGLDTTQAVLIDGSGLPGNVITANSEVQLQSIMAKRPDAEEWRSTLPGLGVDGSLAKVQADTPSAGKVVGKTGTLASVDGFNDERYFLPAKALGGYIETEGGRHFAFTIIATNSVFDDVQGVFAANDDVGKVAASIQQAY